MEIKGILIGAIIGKLNERVAADNKKLCEQNMHSEQKPLHGADMFFKLAYMDIEAIKKIAIACKL